MIQKSVMYKLYITLLLFVDKNIEIKIFSA